MIMRKIAGANTLGYYYLRVFILVNFSEFQKIAKFWTDKK